MAAGGGRGHDAAGGRRGDPALGRRLVSAAVGLPVLAAAVLLGWPATAAAASVAALAAGREVARLAAAGGTKAGAAGAAATTSAASGRARAAGAALTLTPVVAVAAGIGAAAGWLAVAVAAAGAAALLAGVALAAALIRWRGDARGEATNDSARAQASTRGDVRRGRDPAFHFLAVAAALYFGGLLAFAAPLSAHSVDGRLWLAFALLVTFAVDTAAYATGRAIGRRRLAPSISPAKTWEGAAGGLLAGAGAGAALAAIFATLADAGFSLRPAAGAAVGVVLAVAAIAGDLAESWLKRRAGVKDAGGLIPGHGGFLDRLDSLAPNLAIVYYVQIWAGG